MGAKDHMGFNKGTTECGYIFIMEIWDQFPSIIPLKVPYE